MKTRLVWTALAAAALLTTVVISVRHWMGNAAGEPPTAVDAVTPGLERSTLVAVSLPPDSRVEPPLAPPGDPATAPSAASPLAASPSAAASAPGPTAAVEPTTSRPDDPSLVSGLVPPRPGMTAGSVPLDGALPAALPGDAAPVEETLKVHSFDAGRSYPLEEWSILDRQDMGMIETASIVPGDGPHGTDSGLHDDDLIFVTGWAGERDIGIRVIHVVFSYCGKVVGAAPVGLPRPDVAESVHPNLNTAGWRAYLAIGHLPRCENGRLQAWAVNRSATNLFALANHVAIDLSQATGETLVGLVASPPFKPGETTDYQAVQMRVLRDTLKVRRGPGLEFDEVTKLDRGVYDGFVMDEWDDWLQVIVVGRTSGWVSSEFIEFH